MIKKFIIFLICLIFSILAFSNEYINGKLNEQDELLNSLEKEMNGLRMTVSSLKDDNEAIILHSNSMQKQLDSCNETIAKMEIVIADTRKALISNKEDTSEILSILGDMQTEINNYKICISELERKNKFANTFAQIAIPALSLPMVINGAYLMATGNENYGRVCLIGGVALFVGAEIAWNGGRFLFRFW